MNKLKNILLTAMICCCFLSCKKDESSYINPNNPQMSNKYNNERSTFAHPKVEGGLLKFQDMESFRATMDVLVNKEIAFLNVWEEDKRFTSMRRHNMKLKENPEVDDAELDANMVVEDIFFATVLNPEGKIKVGDDIWHVQKEKVIKTGPGGREEFLIPVSSANCNRFTERYCSKEYQTNYKFQGSHWNREWIFYASVGMKTNHYHYKKSGWWIFASYRWKSENVAQLGVKLDQWSYCKYKPLGNPPEIVATNIERLSYNAEEVHYIFDDLTGKGVWFCVPQFDRVHHWASDFNSDCHSNPF